jgi:hypothetical protein
MDYHQQSTADNFPDSIFPVEEVLAIFHHNPSAQVAKQVPFWLPEYNVLVNHHFLLRDKTRDGPFFVKS